MTDKEIKKHIFEFNVARVFGWVAFFGAILVLLHSIFILKEFITLDNFGLIFILVSIPYIDFLIRKEIVIWKLKLNDTQQSLK